MVCVFNENEHLIIQFVACNGIAYKHTHTNMHASVLRSDKCVHAVTCEL